MSDRLREALLGLRRGQDGCFCEKGIGHPLLSDHTDACRAARAALDEGTVSPPGGECSSRPETRPPVRCRIRVYEDAAGRMGCVCCADGCGVWGPLGPGVGAPCHFDAKKT